MCAVNRAFILRSKTRVRFSSRVKSHVDSSSSSSSILILEKRTLVGQRTRIEKSTRVLALGFETEYLKKN